MFICLSFRQIKREKGEMSAPIISFSSDNKHGYIDLIIGPMYSGKTSYLLRELNIFEKMGAKVLYINHSLDNRSCDDFSTHNPLITKIGNIDSQKVTNLFDIFEQCKEYSIIGIDEAQFFNGLEKFVIELAERFGKRIIVAGLNGNFKRQAFGEVLQLVLVCDRLTKLSSCCHECSKQKIIKEAHFSYRVKRDHNNIMIGGVDEYIPLCRQCFCFFRLKD
jgi:thymidine kinase